MDATLLGHKALPTPTLTLPDTLFSTFWLNPSFLLKINAFLMWFEIWKGREKKFANRRIWTRVDRVKMSTAHILPSAPLELTTVNSLL